MSKESRERGALRDLRAGDSEEDITRRYGYGPGIIQALKDTIRRESIWDDEGGPEF